MTGFAFGASWFFENFLDIAHYMADARALILPLIGGLGPEAPRLAKLVCGVGCTKTRHTNWRLGKYNGMDRNVMHMGLVGRPIDIRPEDNLNPEKSKVR